MIYFVSGASGSGKTAIIEDLKIWFKDIKTEIVDFDNVEIPEIPDNQWRQETTEYWIRKLAQKKHNTILVGQTVLGEILACPSAWALNKINYTFLEVSDPERIKRLKTRISHRVAKHPTDNPTQECLNWSSWMRMHTHNPQWEQNVIIQDACKKLDFSRWKSLKSWHCIANIKTIETTKMSINQASQEVFLKISEQMFLDGTL